MSQIGTIIKKGHDGEELHGSITTLQFNLEFRLQENSYKRNNQNAPDYLIMAKGHNDSFVQIGSAWLKKANHSTEEFFSMTFDDPSFPNSLNVSAFPNNDGSYNIVWKRRREQKAA